jgi:hypothetical protein
MPLFGAADLGSAVLSVDGFDDLGYATELLADDRKNLTAVRRGIITVRAGLHEIKSLILRV